MKRAFLDTPDGQVHYVTEGSGEPLLLLHMTPRSGELYRDIIPVLAKTRHVIAMDTIGYGESFKPQRQHSIEDFASTVIRLLDSLNIRRTSILGQHTGTLIGMETAAAYPDRVDKLMLYGPPYIADDELGGQLGQLRIGVLEWQIKEDGSHLTGLWNEWKNRAAQQGWPEAPAHLINRAVLDSVKTGEHIASGRNAVAAYTHMSERLKLLQCPTMVMWGTGDLLELTQENKAKVASFIPRCKQVTVEGGTYLAMSQMTDQMADLVLGFLSDPGV